MPINLSEFHDLATRRGPRCWAESLTAKLQPFDVDALSAAFEDSTITNKAISLWMEKRGLKVESHSVGRHRRGECGCGK